MIPSSNALAAEEQIVLNKILACEDYELTDVKRIETNKNHVSFLLNTTDISDGLNENELEQLSNVSDVIVNQSTMGEYQITDYILEPKEPLATIIKEDGSVEYYNEQIVCRSIVKDLGWAGGQQVISNAIVSATTQYFYYDLGPIGPTVKKIYATEATITGDAQNLKKIQMPSKSTGSFRYDENGEEISAGQEVNNGNTYNITGTGTYTVYNGSQYYYATSDPNGSVYVTVKLTLADNSISSFIIRII